MTVNDKKTQNRRKLQSLLRQLFQFDSADLDFGIYRIMNEKRAEVDRFIEEHLLDAVEKGLAQFRAAEREELERQLSVKRAQLGEAALDKTGAVREEFQGLPIAQGYMELRQRVESIEVTEETEACVFNDLYSFFSRYYDNGDFLTKRRYSSKDAKFCVPYNGEEVLLHWANRDQYYVKTTERFTDYRLSAGDYTVWFRLERAEVPQDDVKGDKRYFVLREETPFEFDEEGKTLTIFFQYRPITDEAEARLLSVYNARQPKSGRRKTLDRAVLCEALEIGILEGLDQPDLKAHLAVVPEDGRSSMLGQHLNRYTARNTMDYFVHKDLGGFLRRELDSYLKTELLRLDDVIAGKGSRLSAHLIARARVVKQIAERIITFLAQIEDVQKRLFEKKKFVVQTDYCITLDRVPGEFYPDIVANEVQLEEWRQLFNMAAWEENLLWTGEFDAAFLRNHPYLMLDTAFFDEDFKARLLGTFDDLDGAIDGLLIHGENLQALSLLLARYQRQVKCIYIDPPYNTGEDGFLYKDNYQHSSWLAMMQDRLRTSLRLLCADGLFFTTIDSTEVAVLRLMCEDIFGSSNFLADIAWEKRYTRSNNAKLFYSLKDTILAYRASGEVTLLREPRTEKSEANYRNPDNDPRGPWISSSYVNPATKAERPNLVYSIKNPFSGENISHPTHAWKYEPEVHQQHVKENRLYWGLDGSYEYPRLKKFLSEMGPGMVPIDVWHYEQSGTTDEGGNELKALFGSQVFDNPKPTRLIRRMLEFVDHFNPGDIALDFFAGSGTTAHAVMDISREIGSARKYILIEIGDYLDTVLKPRIQKVAFSADWKGGVPQNHKGTSHMFKYQRLESYEDALNNIHIQARRGEQRRLLYEDFDDYMLHYALDFEIRDSPTLLTQEAFEEPFQYTLKVQRGQQSPQDTVVDLVETFHYLIGMQVRRLEQHEYQDRRYVVSYGEVRTEQGLEKVVTIWRETEGLDLKKEAKWANTQLLTEAADRVYVNGPSFIDKAEPLEITFRQLMDGGPGGA